MCFSAENGIVNKAYQLVADDSIAVPRGHTTATVNQGVDVVDTSNEQDVSHNLLRSKEVCLSRKRISLFCFMREMMSDHVVIFIIECWW